MSGTPGGGAPASGDQNNQGGTTQQNSGTTQQNNQQQQAPQTYEEFIASLPDDHRTLIEANTTNLRNALKSERDAKSKLEKDLRSLSSQLEGNKDAQATVNKLADDVAAERQRADFYAEAHAEGVEDLELAYLAAQRKGLIDGKGRVNWPELRKNHASLFRTEPEPKTVVRGGAGNGSRPREAAGGVQKTTFNDWLRTGEGDPNVPG